MDKIIIGVRDFNMSLKPLDSYTRQNVRKYKSAQNDEIKELRLMDLYRIFKTPNKYLFFNEQKTFSKILSHIFLVFLFAPLAALRGFLWLYTQKILLADSRNYTGYWGLNPGWLQARQITY